MCFHVIYGKIYGKRGYIGHDPPAALPPPLPAPPARPWCPGPARTPASCLSGRSAPAPPLLSALARAHPSHTDQHGHAHTRPPSTPPATHPSSLGPALFAQPTLRVERRLCARARAGHCLAVARVSHIACRKDASHARARGTAAAAHVEVAALACTGRSRRGAASGTEGCSLDFYIGSQPRMHRVGGSRPHRARAGLRRARCWGRARSRRRRRSPAGVHIG